MFVYSSKFVGNQSAAGGGAIFTADHPVNVADSSFDTNQAGGGSGGAIETTGGAITVARSSFTHNYAKGDGGASILTAAISTSAIARFRSTKRVATVAALAPAAASSSLRT